MKYFFIILIGIILIPSCVLVGTKTPEGYLKAGRKYSEKEKYAKAYKSYSKALEGNSTNFILYWERALIEIKTDSLENAIDDIGMYIAYIRGGESQADKKLLEVALMQRAKILKKKGYKADACDDLEDACRIFNNLLYVICY